MSKLRWICLLLFAQLIGFLFCSCGNGSEVVQDIRSGVVSNDYRLDAGSLIPDSVRLDSDYDNFFFSDHLVFLGEKDSEHYVLSLTFNRALADNRYKRGEKDFTGFIYQGRKWTTLPYTRMRHDSLRLDLNYPYVFGSLSFSDSHTSGEVNYDRHGLKFDLRFDSLQPVQATINGTAVKHCHAIGTGTLTMPNDTISGQVYYELIQLEGYNPFVNLTEKLRYYDHSWWALTSASGSCFLAAGDSATTAKGVLKSFVSVLSRGTLRYADGADHVNITPMEADPRSRSSERKKTAAPEIGFEAEITMMNSARTCVGEVCLSVVDGTVLIDGKPEPAWGVVEQRRQATR